MCGRFNITDDPLAQLLMDIAGGQMNWPLTTEYKIAPTQIIPVMLSSEHGWEVRPMRWWLVPYWTDAPTSKYAMFNARSETVMTSRAFKEPFRTRRCIIPVSGYYEWRKEAGVKVPLYIEPENAPGLALAGLWDRWTGDGQVIESCTIVTSAAPSPMDEIHHRVPVSFTPQTARQWVSADTSTADLQTLMQPEIRVSLKVTPVSTYVNNARNKDDRCIEYLGETRIIN